MGTKQTVSRVPREGRSAIGDKGELWFASQLPYGWIWQPPRKDLGKDGLIVIRDESELHNLEFSVQIKTTQKPRLGNGELRFSNVSRSSVLYWMAGAYPTLIVAVNLSKESAWFAWHYELFRSVEDVQKAKGGSMTISVPTANELNSTGWNNIRSEIKRCYNRLYNSMSNGDSFVWIVASTSMICKAARNLLAISESLVPGKNFTEDEGFKILLEQQQHRNVLSMASKLLNGLNSETKLYRELLEWMSLYEATVRQAFPRLGPIAKKVDNDPGSEVAFKPDALSSSRRHLIFMVFDLVELITRIRPSGSHNAA